MDLCNVFIMTLLILAPIALGLSIYVVCKDPNVVNDERRIRKR